MKMFEVVTPGEADTPRTRAHGESRELRGGCRAILDAGERVQRDVAERCVVARRGAPRSRRISLYRSRNIGEREHSRDCPKAETRRQCGAPKVLLREGTFPQTAL